MDAIGAASSAAADVRPLGGSMADVHTAAGGGTPRNPSASLVEGEAHVRKPLPDLKSDEFNADLVRHFLRRGLVGATEETESSNDKDCIPPPRPGRYWYCEAGASRRYERAVKKRCRPTHGVVSESAQPHGPLQLLSHLLSSPQEPVALPAEDFPERGA